MIDQLIIGGKASYDDFEASVKERTIEAPAKKTIKESVPFSNKVYDFSAINGEVYWNERTLTYVFEITADSPEELERKKQGFMSWVMNVMAEELHDPFITDYHFIATYNGITIDDSEIEKSTIEVNFTAYPYMISNERKFYSKNIGATSQTIKVENNSSHRVSATLTSTVPFNITKDNTTISFPSGTISNDQFMLDVGVNSFSVVSPSGNGTFTIGFYEEVF